MSQIERGERPTRRIMSFGVQATCKKLAGWFVFPPIEEPEHPATPSQFSRDEYAKIREKLWSQRSASVDKIDNIVLTISGAFLGLSITFLKDIVQPAPPSHPEILWWSWAAFTLAIALVFLSHYSSYCACGYELKRNEFYFVKRIDEVLNLSNGWQTVTQIFNISAALIFLVGITLSADFVKINMEKKFDNAGKQSQRAVSPDGSPQSTNRLAGGGSSRYSDAVSNSTAQRTAGSTTRIHAAK